MIAALRRSAKAALLPILALVGGGAACADPAPAVDTHFVHLGPGVPAVLYEPAMPGPKAATAVFIMHSSADYLSFAGCTELAKRGYRVLCANNSTSKSGASNDGVLDKVLLEAKLGVAWLRHDPGVRHVVLLGHSGGGTVMSAYQDIAENGVAVCQSADKLWKCPDALAGLPPADGLMLIDSNWGLAEMTLFSVDPAITRPDSGKALDPALDMYDPANGFRPTGSAYSPAFVAKFERAEGRRYAALIDRAETEWARIKAGNGPYDDDEPFDVPGAVLLGSNNKLFSQDLALMAHTRQAWPLLHADGSITREVIHSVRVPENVRNPSPSFIHGALKTTLRSFLSTYAVRVQPDFGYDADSVRGIDWTSSYASPPGNVEGVHAPLLVMGMTGHWEYLASETIYDLAGSRDKSIAFVDGATHLYTTCRKCERHPGEFGDTQKTTYDYIDRWLSAPGRFAAPAQSGGRTAS